jgi:hypothetical protein
LRWDEAAGFSQKQAVADNSQVETQVFNFGKSVRWGDDMSSAFPICSTTKKIFLGWVKEVRTKKS